MKFISIGIMLTVALFATTTSSKYVAKIVPKNMSVHTKKERFYALLVPAVQKVHSELQKQYEKVAKEMKNDTNATQITTLKIVYKATTDDELLGALKPHPQSIVLAQAAMESAWATSRFFVEANNVFGMWSTNSNEPRIAAGVKRGGKYTIWLRKFDSIEASIRAYYRLMARGKAFKEFRALRLKTEDPYELVKKLDKYSEIGAAYGEELSQVIRYNKLIQYDKNYDNFAVSKNTPKSL